MVPSELAELCLILVTGLTMLVIAHKFFPDDDLEL